MQKEVIETERLLLRKFKRDDAFMMFVNWASDPEVTKYLTFSPHENVGVTQMIIDKWIDEYQKEETVRYCITIKGNDEPIGSIDIVNIFDNIPEIGYCLSRKHWNKGYMSEACNALVHYLFEIGYKKVCICANVNNIGSNRVIQKCGLKLTKQFEKEIKGHTELINCYIISK